MKNMAEIVFGDSGGSCYKISGQGVLMSILPTCFIGYILILRRFSAFPELRNIFLEV